MVDDAVTIEDHEFLLHRSFTPFARKKIGRHSCRKL
ncbi:unnamed protein product [Mycetohabitans rhizoxinica HKI 454]|uniref:Uncharacterized protein n=1 Tax=Mycetohabitans rhizoxinica (strain DSM 19002 / CIP 109453 / HKI 454) TaxID=882378 RepID=E5AL37_MYCRK|nr:unnamed protein product [Mycetohabitans rhizoxinica HKI 454]